MEQLLPEGREALVRGNISTFSGEVVETDHIEEVSGLVANGSGSTWTDVHREVWIRPPHGTERRFAFLNVDVAARKGHRVTLLLNGDEPLAFINFSTEQYVKLLARRQFAVFGAVEAFAFAALLVGAGLSGVVGLVALAIGASAYGMIKWLVRQERYREASAFVETEIRRTVAHPPDAVTHDHSQPDVP